MLSRVPRAADLPVRIGLLPSGSSSSVLDVPGVGLGHATVSRDEPDPPAGRGVARTGVTVLDPGGNCFQQPIPAGAAVLNGAGECTGLLSIREWGLVESPIFLTSTMQLGRVYDAACEMLADEEPAIGVADVLIPVVAECDDSFLSDARRMQVSADDVRTALDAARDSRGQPDRLEEGSVGAGTGMSCLGWKGGIGTASRVVPSGDTVGVLVLTNFGDHERLTIAGVPVGALLPPDDAAHPPPPAGSCIVVVVTDAPLDSAACTRLARRAGLGLARTGSTASHASGEIFLALATGLRAPRGRTGSPNDQISGSDLDPFFAAVVTSLLTATTVVGRSGNTCTALPFDDVRRLLAEHRHA